MEASVRPFSPARLDSGVPVIVISLDDQAERRRDLVARGIPRHWVRRFFPGVDLRGASPETLRRQAQVAELENLIGRRVQPGEIGCAMSHRAAAGWLAASDYAMALVLEDDIIPQSTRWLEQMTATSRALLPHARRGGAFICHLGARHDQADAALKRRVVWEQGFPPPETPDLFLHADPNRALWRAHAYMISRAAAERSWRGERTITALADDWCARRRRGWIAEIFFTRPVLIGQDEDRPSTIRSPDRVAFREPSAATSPVDLLPAVAASRLLRRARASVTFRMMMGVALLRSRFPYRVSLSATNTDRPNPKARPPEALKLSAGSRLRGGGMTAAPDVRVLHITNWYPNPWCDVEGIFVRAQYELFRQVTQARLVNVQVRTDKDNWLRLHCTARTEHERGYFILTRFSQTRIQALLTTLLLMAVCVRERAWRYDLLHFHIAWPLLAHAHLWRRVFRVPVVISEHWSAYHFNFYLSARSPGAQRISRVFRQGIPVIAVSRALLEDIRAFSGSAVFAGYVIPNVVALQEGTSSRVLSRVPVLFAVNNWRRIKDPFSMLEGLARCAAAGAEFELVIGGFGELFEPMKEFVGASPLALRTRFPGKMTKPEIAAQLAASDGYLFSSHYETFSVACAEALGAGVPIVGPFLSAVAEYADPCVWECVETRDGAGWAGAITRFLARAQASEFDRSAIAARAATRFSSDAIRQSYVTDVLGDLGLTPQSSPAPERSRP